MSYAFFRVIPKRLNFICQRFGKHSVCSVFIGGLYVPTRLWRWNRQSVSKRWHIKFRRRGITQKKAYNIQNTAKVWNQDISFSLHHWSLDPALSCKSLLTTNNLKWILLSSGMWHHVVSWQCTGVSEDSAAYFFTLKFEDRVAYSSVDSYHCLGKVYCPPPHLIHVWRVQVLLKWFVSIKLYHVTSQKIILLICTCHKWVPRVFSEQKFIGAASCFQRWRRRWFVLRHSGELPGQYFLEYYTDRNCRKLKGKIDLDQCEQVSLCSKYETYLDCISC